MNGDKIPPLTLEELEGAVKSGRKVAFHPRYANRKLGKFTVESVERTHSGSGLVAVNDGRMRREVADNGVGLYSGHPVFIWADDLGSGRPSDGKCHCASPKPVMLLVRTVCDICGGEIV